MTTAEPAQETGTTVLTEVREGSYGGKIAAVEPGGAEFIPLDERHGRPLSLFWTWTSPNFEFATVFVGCIPIIFFGETFVQAALAVVLGTALGSVSMGFLSARGPLFGVPQMVLSRIGFGYWGNWLPAGINSLVAGVGWFAVNSVSGALALHALWNGLPEVAALLIIVVLQIGIAFVGYNLVHAFERYAFPILMLIFVAMTIVAFSKATPGALGGGVGSPGGIGGFLISFGAAFGYAAGWNPYASDYTRYFAPDSNRRAVGLWAGLGVFASCVLLELGGAAAATIGFTTTGKFPGPVAGWFDNPTASFVGVAPHWLADATLLAIALGAIAANVLNVYSGAMSFLALGIKIPFNLRRALVALVFGLAGFFLAWSGLNDAGAKYNDFLLIIAYWIGPWLGVFFADQVLRRRERVDHLLYNRRHNPLAGFLAMLIGGGVAIWLFSNQNPGEGLPSYVGWVPKHHPAFGDLTFEVGTILAALLYWLFHSFEAGRTPAPPADADTPTA
jgi:nucleobase:cation symporter-1, NCS1 family